MKVDPSEVRGFSIEGKDYHPKCVDKMMEESLTVDSVITDENVGDDYFFCDACGGLI